MNYLPRSRSQSKSKKVLFLVALFFLGAFLFSIFDNVLITLVSPLWRGENYFSSTLRKSTDFFHTRLTLIDENELLKEKVAALELTLSSKSFEANTLNQEVSGVRGLVLTHPPQSPYDLIDIDVVNGPAVSGDRVFLPEGPEIGIVSEILGRYAKVKLYTTVGAQTNAVLERHEVPVTLEGLGGGNFKVIVPRETEVVVGDRIISPTADGALMAIVESIELQPTDAFKGILAKSPTNVFSIRTVSIRP